LRFGKSEGRSGGEAPSFGGWLCTDGSFSDLVDDLAHAAETLGTADKSHDPRILVEKLALGPLRVVGHALLLRRRLAIATIPLAAGRFVLES
jgi:hypothetical protein